MKVIPVSYSPGPADSALLSSSAFFPALRNKVNLARMSSISFRSSSMDFSYWARIDSAPLPVNRSMFSSVFVDSRFDTVHLFPQNPLFPLDVLGVRTDQMIDALLVGFHRPLRLLSTQCVVMHDPLLCGRRSMMESRAFRGMKPIAFHRTEKDFKRSRAS